MYLRLIILILNLLCVNVIAQQSRILPSERPKLVIGIMIDLMRYDYIYKYWDKFDNNGIKRLINEGSFFKNAHYNYLFNPSSVGFATVATGTNPNMHGIIADSWYAPLSAKEIQAASSDKYTVIGSKNEKEVFSCSNLLVSTFSDELRISNFKKSKVFSVSIDGTSAVLSGGHLANTAFWFDSQTGNWITSSEYVKELPAWVKEFNDKKLPDTYLTRSWETIKPIAEYTECLPDDNNYEIGIKGQKKFPYNLNLLSTTAGSNERIYEVLKFTPFANNLTKDFAISTIVNENMGKGAETDYIAINFSATEYIAKQFGILSVETEDAYLRLDKEIQHFLDFIDSYLGKGNVLVYLTSNHGAAHNPVYMTEIGIPSGVFNQSQALYLLQRYLNILYGKGDWVKFFKNQQIFLNRDLIQNSKLKLQEVQDETARFMIQFSGITNVATASQLQRVNYTSGIFQKMQNSFNQKRSGDVIFNFEPGWVDSDDSFAGHNSPYTYDTHVPLIFYGWKISRQTIYEKVDMTDIAPTISTFLDIAYPSGCVGKPLMQLLK